MTICAVNRALKHFGFTLHGRPLASTEEGDYLLAIAGAGKVLPRHEGKRRGVGRIGYDFDNIHTLRGTGPTGKLGFGYRAAGRARQLNIGLRELVIDGADQAISALYRFTHVLGRGGRLAFTVNADFVKKEGEQLVKGQDGQAELGRAVLVWVRAGAARAVAAICGGTVGEGTCVRIRECWRANGELSFEELAAEDAAARWEETACPAERDLPLPVDEPPAEDELQVPADGGEAPGPAVEQPGELPDLE
ncbi:MAG: hypothetical protein FJ125_08035 [Deltaproteobacteria bacterium]|nr:hypothetical protein [Deltaproteobacteria bacterium]